MELWDGRCRAADHNWDMIDRLQATVGAVLHVLGGAEA